jgi:hypothetical protein
MLDVNQLFPGMSPDVLEILEAAPKDEDVVMATNDLRKPLSIDEKYHVDLIDFDTRQKQEAAYSAMRAFLLKRCHYSLFDSKETLDTLIDYSGGNARDSLRLLNYTCRESDTTPFDLATVHVAAGKLAADYRNWLLKEDYPLLAEEDLHATKAGHSAAISRLIEQGALLQYNGGNWRQSHPVIRLLPAYTAAAQALTTTAGIAAP